MGETVPDTDFEDNESVDLEDEFNFSQDMFEDDDDEIDTTILDGDLFEDDDFDDDFDIEDDE